MSRSLLATVDRPVATASVPAAQIAAETEQWFATVIDAMAVVLASALVLVLATGSDNPLRPALALVFTLLVPGWTAIRAFRGQATMLSAVGAIALSIAIMMVLGQSLVLFGNWEWKAAGLVLAATCALVGLVTMRRRTVHGDHVINTAARSSAVITWPSVLAIASVVVGNTLVVVGVRRSTTKPNDFLGLVDVLSGWYWLGVGVIVVGLVVVCAQGSRWAWMGVAALLVALHGLPGMLEPNPRFSIAWIHNGFSGQIAEHGTLLRNLDARFSWAGFFAGNGLLQRLAGTESLMWLVRYAPLFINACSVVLVAVLARRLRSTEVQAVAAASLFCCLNWIGQDYFAPQATAFVLYLTVITVVLTAYPADPAQLPRWVRRLLRPEAATSEGIHGHRSLAVLLACYLAIIAIVISHQLTPGFLMSSLLMLVVLRTTRLRMMPVFVAVVFLAWLSFGADAYWFGHFESLTGSVGEVGSLVNQNVGKRTESTVFERQVVVGSRIAIALVSWAFTSLVLVIRWFKHRTPVALLCLFAAPFAMLPLQPYGGEMALRVCYFSLPAVVILLAQTFVPATARVSLRRIVPFAVLLGCLIPVFVLARFGNEAFEAFSDADVRLSEQVYATVPDGAVVYVETKQTLLYWQRVDTVRFRSLPAGTVAEMTDTLTKRLDRNPQYILLAESQSAYRIIAGGRAQTWMPAFIDELLATGRYSVRARVGEGVLLQLDAP